jgi:hypothetical protein
MNNRTKGGGGSAKGPSAQRTIEGLLKALREENGALWREVVGAARSYQRP